MEFLTAVGFEGKRDLGCCRNSTTFDTWALMCKILHFMLHGEAIQKESLIRHLNVLSAPNGNMEKVKNANSVDTSKASRVAATVLLMV